MTTVTCTTCGKVAEREDADEAGWLFYEEAECDVCLDERMREAFREFRRENAPGEYEAAQRAKYPGLVP